MIARLDDKLKDCKDHPEAPDRGRAVANSLPEFSRKSCGPGPPAQHKPMTLTWSEAAAFAFRRSEDVAHTPAEDCSGGFPPKRWSGGYAICSSSRHERCAATERPHRQR